MNLLERLKKEETKLGKVLAYYIPSILVFIAGTVEVLEALQTLPLEVPFDTKKVIAIATLVGIIGGKLTVKKDA
jgi:hypothetical protein